VARVQRLAETLLLQAIDLDDYTILDDHPDFSVPDVVDGLSDLIEFEGPGWG
jgi:hypothetical protein